MAFQTKDCVALVTGSNRGFVLSAGVHELFHIQSGLCSDDGRRAC